MELRYCEECGDVIRLDSDEPLSLNEHFVCSKCKGDAPAEPARAEPPKDDTKNFAPDELNLFSSQSIAERKQDVENETQKLFLPAACAP